MSTSEVQKVLRHAFKMWGLPARMRVDNGYPWGSKGDLPTELALWLLGLGIDMIWNPPGRPQDNGVIERSQGVGKNWAEPKTCSTIQQLQRRLNKFDRLQRERYPAVDKQARIQAYPELLQPRRHYSVRRETVIWNWMLVGKHLEQYTIIRKVDHSGVVSLYNRPKYVGRHYVGQYVVIHYDSVQHDWEFNDTAGHLIRRLSAPELSADRITRLNVQRRREKLR